MLGGEAIHQTAVPDFVAPAVARLLRQHLWDARRMYLSFSWDETPHYAALLFLDYVLSPEGQQLFEALGRVPASMRSTRSTSRR